MGVLTIIETHVHVVHEHGHDIVHVYIMYDVASRHQALVRLLTIIDNNY